MHKSFYRGPAVQPRITWKRKLVKEKKYHFCYSNIGRLSSKVSKVIIDLLSASRLKQTSNALERSLVIWDHTVLPATRQRWISRLYSLAFTNTHFTVPRRVEGWVDLGTAGQMQQPVPKTAYRSNCGDKHTDGGSHPQPGTPALDHCTLLCQVRVRNLARVTTQQRGLGIELTTIESQVERPSR